MSTYAEFQTWLRSENASRAMDGHPPLDVDAPIYLERRLESCDAREWSRKELIRRWRWFLDGYLHGYVTEATVDREKTAFVKEARSLIALQEFMDAMRSMAEPRPLSEKEQKRRNEWLAHETARQARLERQRQRRLLREGQLTMTAIRRHLRGQAPLPPPESTPERSSPTS